MMPAAFGGAKWRKTASPSPGPQTTLSSKVNMTSSPRTQQSSSTAMTSGTFAPKFIKADNSQDQPSWRSNIDGESDFSGKRYVWLKDSDKAFSKGWVVEELAGRRLLVQCDDGNQRDVAADSVDKVNPAKFDKADDMAELTHLNEPSVVHNLFTRYQTDLIYTYSGLFLVTVNPYCPLPIYSREYINMYRGRSREETRPHIYAMADEAFRSLVDEGQNQSILVTGESGAGKTENTKKVIQYLAAVATTNSISRSQSPAKQTSNLSEQILRANPILEAFGNAQTVRNNNSSRFGKFIRIELTRSGHIAGAFIEWYLLEKSRVVRLNSSERNYHIFYQLLRGADDRMKKNFFLQNAEIGDFVYTQDGNDVISGVSDSKEWDSLIEAFNIMGFSNPEQESILRTVASILHLGNVTIGKESIRGDQAAIDDEVMPHVERACHLLGIPVEPFVQSILRPRVKAGREWVEKVQTPEQARLSIDALAKGIYERGFGNLVDRINSQLDRSATGADDSHFIGVLDIAGFEIFEENSFEQLCINYTNEKLQQFFNHHMFVLEQEEYAREQIEWNFVDFGRDLQPTIDMIELHNPIGIFSCLDEDCVMPKATDKSFTEKLHSLWDKKSNKYRRSLLKQGFTLTHYAADVEYSTDGWLEKNKDPLNDNVTRLLAKSSEKHIAELFADCADVDDDTGGARSRVKKGLFRTVAQGHKDRLSSLMGQLHSTHPHFVRCILPNHKKKPKQFSSPLVLDQLRCNGVLEGIRIARTGFPNRLPFLEFRQRYGILCHNLPKGYFEGQTTAKTMMKDLQLDPALYRVGLTKVFFRAGVLAELEEKRDALIQNVITRFQSVARGYMERRMAHKRLYRTEATRIIQRNFQVYLDLQSNPWWRLFVRMRPLLGATRQAAEVKKRDDAIRKLESEMQAGADQRQRIEDEKRRVENEVARVQKTLESERALALDKEAIFKRLQDRETELSEKLAGAIDDQESLEDQLDELIAAKQQADKDSAKWRKELEQAGSIISKLEVEKNALLEKIAALDTQIVELEHTKSARSAEEERLDQDVRMLQSQLSLKDRKLQDLEAKVLKYDQDLEVKFAASTKELLATKKDLKDAADQNRQIRQQMADLSSTSTSFEDLIRRKDSELAVLKSENKKFDSDRRLFDEEKRKLAQKHDDVQNRLRESQSLKEVADNQRAQLQREAEDAKKVLEDRLSADAQAHQGRKMLEKQNEDLKSQLYQVQTELSRERQSRDDVQLLGEHRFSTLQRDYDSLNDSKITIEKEMYSQQDILRRSSEAKVLAERERKEFQLELQNLRRKFIELQEAKLEADSSAERTASRVASERQAILRKELESKAKQLESALSENDGLTKKVQSLTSMMADSDDFKAGRDQHKERLERELVTTKGRLAASENDNRSLLNKIQQKNLDIARSNSKAGDSQRTRISQLSTEKTKLEDEHRALGRKFEDLQLTVASLTSQKEKLAVTLDDLRQESSRGQKSARDAERASSTINIQLADVNRKLETERQLRTQTQTNARTVQSTLDNANRELAECRQQLVLLRKVFDPESPIDLNAGYEASRSQINKTVDLAQMLDNTQQALKVATTRYTRAETQVDELRGRHRDEISEIDARHNASRRNLLEEMNSSQINQVNSPRAFHNRQDSENKRPFTPIRNSIRGTPTRTPNNHAQIHDDVEDSARSDRTSDTVSYSNRMDMAAELELVQNQLQMSEMRNKHLQTQIDSSPMKGGWQEDSPSHKRMHKLERENVRLHDMLDDSAKKVSNLEKSIRTGELTLREVRTKSHEELYDLINSQESSRQSLLQSYNNAISELAEAKTSFDDIKHNKISMEVELRDARSELNDLNYEREQDHAAHSQLLEEFSDLQIRLDAETSKLLDVTHSLDTYRTRADEYFNKLEQAEIAVLKASRAEQFAKTQARDAEEQCAKIMSERERTNDMLEDLQRQTQQYEERIDDLSADLEGTLQGKKRLQNELEDWRGQRAIDIEDKEMSMEQTRKKYSAELAGLSHELTVERENVIHSREENGVLREEIEELRSKWDDEVLNSSTWAKEKARLELTLQDVSNARDEAADAHSEAQTRIVSLLGQVRELRSGLDELNSARDVLVKEKKNLESRLSEANDRLEDLARGESPSMRNAAEMDRELLDLKSGLAQQEDIAAAAVGKMRRAEALSQEIQKDIQTERDNNVRLRKEKMSLEKNLKDLQLRLVDLETKGYASAGQDARFLQSRIQELERSLEDAESTRNAEARSVRNVDRTVRDLQSQIERRDKQNTSLSEDLAKARDKLSTMLTTIDELQSSDSANQLAAKRADRELNQEREARLRVERELEGWKGLRMDRDSARRSQLGLSPPPGLMSGSDAGGGISYSRRGSAIGGPASGIDEIGSISGTLRGARKVSDTKGFL